VVGLEQLGPGRLCLGLRRNRHREDEDGREVDVDVGGAALAFSATFN
jgi:hypothetical protein